MEPTQTIEVFKYLSSSTFATGGVIAMSLVFIAMNMPKILNILRVDRADGSLLERMEKYESRIRDQDNQIADLKARLDKQDDKIHKYAVKVTRCVVLITQLEGLLLMNGIQIPESVKREIEELRKDGEDE